MGKEFAQKMNYVLHLNMLYVPISWSRLRLNLDTLLKVLKGFRKNTLYIDEELCY